MTRAPHPITLHSLNLADAERVLCVEALRVGKTIRAAAVLLGVTRHALQRRIEKHSIERTWHGQDDE